MLPSLLTLAYGLVSGASASAAQTPELSGTTGDIVIWEIVRASGIVAFVLLSVSVAMGVSVNARALDSVLRRALVFEAHQTISLLALVSTALHMLLLLANRHVPLGLVGLLAPFSSNWKPVPLGLGTLAFYLIFLLIVTSYARQQIGQRAWRLIHYAGFLGWALAMVHGITAGSDTREAWVQYLYLLTAAVTGLLIMFRVLAPSRRRQQETAASRKTQTARVTGRAIGGTAEGK